MSLLLLAYLYQRLRLLNLGGPDFESWWFVYSKHLLTAVVWSISRLIILGWNMKTRERRLIVLFIHFRRASMTSWTGRNMFTGICCSHADIFWWIIFNQTSIHCLGHTEFHRSNCLAGAFCIWGSSQSLERLLRHPSRINLSSVLVLYAIEISSNLIFTIAGWSKWSSLVQTSLLHLILTIKTSLQLLLRLIYIIICGQL